NKLLPQIVNAAVQITDAEEGYIILIENKQMIRRAHKPINFEQARATQEAINDRIAEYVVGKQEAMTLGPDRLRKSSGSNAPLSVASVPLRLGNRVLGALQVINYNNNKYIFSKNDSMMLQALSDYAAISI